jgi:CHAT domain-containing protein/Tfp pilus assembly protein PilF
MEAQKAFNEGEKLRAARQYAEAVPPIERALQLREAILGGTHLEVASCLNMLGDTYRLQGDYARAGPLLQRALTIREATLGKHHPDVASSLHNIATLYHSQGQYARAEPLYERALAIREATLGKHHPDVASSLNNLAALYMTQRYLARAKPLYERALAIREASLGPNHLDFADSLLGLANLYMHQGDYAQAESLHQRTLTIVEAALGKNHLRVATSLNNLANLYVRQGKYAEAEPLYQRALAIRETLLGKSHPDIAQSLNNLAALRQSQGNHAEAEPLYQRALAIRETLLGKSHPDIAQSLNNLATLYSDQGKYGEAELLYERALSIVEAALDKNHPDVADSIHNLANIHYHQGNYTRAEPLYQRALAIQETTLGKSHPHVAVSLNTLANLYVRQEKYAEAEPLYQRALAIQETALGKHHPDVANSLKNLATSYKEQGYYARAEPLYEHALSIQEAALGKHHPDVADSLNNLAILYAYRGLYARAEPLFERVLAIREAAFGKNNPWATRSLNNLAQLYIAQGHLDEALPLLTRALTASEEHLRQEVFGLSEVRLASVLQLLRADEERLYSLVRAHPDDVRVRHIALSAALLRKGRSVEEISDTSRIIYRGLGQADRETFDRLRALRTQFAMLSLAGPRQLSPADYQQRLKDLADQGDTLEADVARRSAPLRARHALPFPNELIEHVAKALPKDGVLVELVAYNDSPLVPKSGSSPASTPSELRYLALLLFPDGRTSALDLGSAAPIDRAALRLHDALASRSVTYQTAARELHTRAFRPLVPLLGKVRRLFIAPDSQLALVPFAALHNGRQFLVDSFDITYLTSGKDLLPRLDEIPPAQSVVVLADPYFGSPPAAPSPSAPTTSTLAERSTALKRFFSTPRADLPDQPWPPLPGTRKEAEAIQRLLPQARLLLGPAATKDALLKLATPGLLHVATHGFFLEDASTQADTRGLGSLGAIAAGPPQNLPDPLLRSGLVLAGAHNRATELGSSRHEDFLVTALELAGLNLWGTQLVVLSACETGRGDVKLGQGVYGLRRALVVAGAETLVTSLWKVNDDTTREFMEGYYRNLLAGQGRTAALRETMRALRQKQPHPYFWAPFIAIGRDSPLRGIAPPTVAVQSP